jgi:FtsH-binding integral membrane protein
MFEPRVIAMSELHGKFDWLAFVVREIVIVALATWMLLERIHMHDRTGIVFVAGIGYVVMPIVAYLHTRYQNSWLIGGIVAMVRRNIAARRHGG